VDTYTDFLAEVSIKYELQHISNELRYGQVYFNTLYERKPKIANELRGSLLDPFHRDNCPPAVHEFVEKRWTNE
jgi:hypothetical protein